MKKISLNNYTKKGFIIDISITNSNIEEHTISIFHHEKKIGFLKINYIPKNFLDKYVYSDFNFIHFVNDFFQDTGINTTFNSIDDKKLNIFFKKYHINLDKNDKNIESINFKFLENFQNDLDSYINKVDKFYISNIFIDKEYRNLGLGLFLFELGAYYAYKNNNRLYSDPDKRITNFIWRKFEMEEKYDFSVDDYNLQSIINKRKPILKIK